MLKLILFFFQLALVFSFNIFATNYENPDIDGLIVKLEGNFEVTCTQSQDNVLRIIGYPSNHFIIEENDRELTLTTAPKSEGISDSGISQHITYSGNLGSANISQSAFKNFNIENLEDAEVTISPGAIKQHINYHSDSFSNSSKVNISQSAFDFSGIKFAPGARIIIGKKEDKQTEQNFCFEVQIPTNLYMVLTLKNGGFWFFNGEIKLSELEAYISNDATLKGESISCSEDLNITLKRSGDLTIKELNIVGTGTLRNFSDANLTLSSGYIEDLEAINFKSGKIFFDGEAKKAVLKNKKDGSIYIKKVIENVQTNGNKIEVTEYPQDLSDSGKPAKIIHMNNGMPAKVELDLNGKIEKLYFGNVESVMTSTPTGKKTVIKSSIRQ